jgi:hypothetical protein
MVKPSLRSAGGPEARWRVGLRHTRFGPVDPGILHGQPRSITLRATQVYRREGDEWKVAHRHAETVTE